MGHTVFSERERKQGGDDERDVVSCHPHPRRRRRRRRNYHAVIKNVATGSAPAVASAKAPAFPCVEYPDVSLAGAAIKSPSFINVPAGRKAPPKPEFGKKIEQLAFAVGGAAAGAGAGAAKLAYDAAGNAIYGLAGGGKEIALAALGKDHVSTEKTSGTGEREGKGKRERLVDI